MLIHILIANIRLSNLKTEQLHFATLEIKAGLQV